MLSESVMDIAPSTIAVRLESLLRSAGSILGLRLCFHDRLQRSGARDAWWQVHHDPACLERKRTHQTECANFDGSQVHHAIAGSPEGRIHACPFGFTEITVPVHCEGEFAGVLFAGPCWVGKGKPPHPDLIRPASPDWIEERRRLLKAVATELGE